MKQAKISIALATYNGVQYLNEQLNSYLKQSRMPDELVVCDDCSTDETLVILENFQRSAPFPVLIEQNTANKGCVASFANSISRCSGNYIFYSDQDDVWFPEKIETMMSTFEENPDTGLVFCNAEVVDNMLSPLGCTFWEAVWFDERERKKVENNQAFDIFLKHIVVAGMSAAFRADLLSIILPMPALQDGYDGWTALLASTISRITTVNQSLVKYRVHDNNQVGVHTLGFMEQLKIGKQQVRDNTFPNLLFLKKEALRRLSSAEIKEKYEIDDYFLKSLQKNIAHLSRRINLSRWLPLRLIPILHETLRWNYFKYSYGFKSIAQDLFLR